MTTPRPRLLKDSGIASIGQIPADWDVVAARRHLRLVARAVGKRAHEYDLLSLTKQGIILRDISENKGKFPASFDTYQEVRPGDLVLCLFDIDETPRTVGLSPLNGMVTGAYSVFASSVEWYRNYLYLLLLHLDEAKGLKPYYSGLRKTIRPPEFLSIKFPVPSEPEVRNICRYVDRETARIDALIEKKTRFIELLKEKRQALLHDCLMHPDTIRMRVERCTESPTRPIDRDDEVSYTRLGLYNRGRGIFHKPEAIGRELGDSSFTWVHEGDLIVSGQFAWEGAVSLASNDEHGCVISHRYHTYRGKHDVTDTAYLWAYFTSHEGDFVLNDHSRGSAGRNRPLNPNTLAKEKIPVPPMVMQKRVAALVEFENRFKALVARSTALLNERRSALITGAVTGQLDLRENAA